MWAGRSDTLHVFLFLCLRRASYLVSIHHDVVGGDQGFEDHHPAGVGRALEQRVGQLGDAHIHLVGAVDQIWQGQKKEDEMLHKVWTQSFERLDRPDRGRLLFIQAPFQAVSAANTHKPPASPADS